MAVWVCFIAFCQRVIFNTRVSCDCGMKKARKQWTEDWEVTQSMLQQGGVLEGLSV